MNNDDVASELKTLTWEIDEENSRNLAKQALPLQSLDDTPLTDNEKHVKAIPLVRSTDPKKDAILAKVAGEAKGSKNEARERAKAKIQEIRKLRKENAQLKTKVSQHDQQLHATLTEVKVRDKQIKELQDLTKRLEDHLEEESANLKFYKQRVKNFDEDTQKYRDRIRELIELKQEETEVRQKLEQELKEISSELMSLREAKTEAEEKASNIQKKLDIRIQLGEEMKENFKEEKLELNMKIEQEHNRFEDSQHQAEKLALDVVKLSKENMSLEKELTKQDETIQGIFAETESQQKVISLLQTENRGLRSDLTTNEDERERLQTELETANDRMQKMAERVYYLVNRLTTLEDYKKETERKLRVNMKEMEEVQHRVKQLQGQVQAEIESKLTVEDEVKALRQSTVEFRKAATDYESKFKKLRKANRKMQELLQAKTLKLRELLASSEIRMRKNQDDSGQRNMYATLQKKIDQLINSSEFLKKKVHHLERVNSKYQYSIRKKEGEIKDLKKHSRLITAFSNTQTGSLKKQAKSSAGKGSGWLDCEELYRALSKDFGDDLEAFLQYYNLDEQLFFSRLTTPVELFRYIANRHRHVMENVHTNPSDPDSRRVQQLERNNATLASSIHECEEVKVKSLMTLASVLANQRNRKSQLPAVLALPSSLIDDNCAAALAEALQKCNHIIKVDLRSNRIGDEGLLRLVGAALANSSLTHLNLRDNKVSLRGMHTLYSRLCKFGDEPPEFEHLNHRRVPILFVRIQERELYIDLRENNFESDMLKNVINGEENSAEDAWQNSESDLSERFGRWLVSRHNSSGIISKSSNSEKKLGKSASTPMLDGKSQKKSIFGNDERCLKKRLKYSALQTSSKVGK